MSFIEEKLLREYMSVPNVGPDGKPIVKILVGYIKPSFLFKSDILAPMHLGRAVAKDISKEGVISDDDYKWMLENTIGDDDFEGNISEHNRKVGFLTGTYWAWKNYEKLGDPEYFGFFGYRRLFAPEFLRNLRKYDFIVPTKKEFQTDLRLQFVNWYGTNTYNTTIEVIGKIYPAELDKVKGYFARNSGYFEEIYILKKTLFFNFCEWIFPVFFELLKIPEKRISSIKEFNDKLPAKTPIMEKLKVNLIDYLIIYQKRMLGFIIERLTGYFLFKLTEDKKLKNFENNVIFLGEKSEHERDIILSGLRRNVKTIRENSLKMNSTH